MSDIVELMELNTEDFNVMRSMLSEIEMKIVQLHPLHQRRFYTHLQRIIFMAWEDACNPEDSFLYKYNKTENNG